MNLNKLIYVGFYQALNLGDDLFLKVLIERYSDQSFLVYDIANYKEFFGKYENVLFLRLLPWRCIGLLTQKLHIKKYSIENILASRCKLAIEIGGSLFCEPYMLEFRNDLITKKPFFIIGANFGPYSNNAYKQKCQNYFSSKTDVCFRDYASYNLFATYSNVRVAPDILWSLKIPYIHGDGLFVSVMHFEKSHPELAQYQNAYEKTLVQVIREWIQQKKKVILGSFCKKSGDEIGIKNIVNAFTMSEKQFIKIHHYCGNIEATLTALNSCEMILATRFHSVVLGLLTGKRVIPICYSNKTENMLDDIGLGDKKNLISNLQYENLKECSLTRGKIQKLCKEAELQFNILDNYLKK